MYAKITIEVHVLLKVYAMTMIEVHVHRKVRRVSYPVVFCFKAVTHSLSEREVTLAKIGSLANISNKPIADLKNRLIFTI